MQLPYIKAKYEDLYHPPKNRAVSVKMSFKKLSINVSFKSNFNNAKVKTQKKT